MFAVGLRGFEYAGRGSVPFEVENLGALRLSTDIRVSSLAASFDQLGK